MIEYPSTACKVKRISLIRSDSVRLIEGQPLEVSVWMSGGREEEGGGREEEGWREEGWR